MSLSGWRAVSVAVVGSIAFDSVRTPFGERERMLGGSAVHFALAASFFTPVAVVGPVEGERVRRHLGSFLRPGSLPPRILDAAIRALLPLMLLAIGGRLGISDPCCHSR
jgi:hypothetical protein